MLNVYLRAIWGSGDLKLRYDIQLSTSHYRLDVADLLRMGILGVCPTFANSLHFKTNGQRLELKYKLVAVLYI